MRFGFSPKTRALLAKTLSHPVFWIGLAVTVVLLDLLAGPAISFPLVFIFPVGLATLQRGFRWGALFALGLPMVRFGLNMIRDTPWPICAWCGKIRAEANSWLRLDTYLSARTDLSFPHAICPTCAAEHFPK